MTNEAEPKTAYEIERIVHSLSYTTSHQKMLLIEALAIVDANDEKKVRTTLDYLHKAQLISRDTQKSLLKKLF